MILRTTLASVALCLLPAPAMLHAQAAKPPAQKQPDTLVFANGEQLTGEFETAIADRITFKSAMAGEIKVPWKNVKELRSDKQFERLTKGQKLKRNDARGGTATGGVSLVRSTQNSTTFNGGINLVRASPGVAWLPARSKTILDFNQSCGTVSQPNTTPPTATKPR